MMVTMFAIFHWLTGSTMLSHVPLCWLIGVPLAAHGGNLFGLSQCWLTGHQLTHCDMLSHPPPFSTRSSGKRWASGSARPARRPRLAVPSPSSECSCPRFALLVPQAKAAAAKTVQGVSARDAVDGVPRDRRTGCGCMRVQQGVARLALLMLSSMRKACCVCSVASTGSSLDVVHGHQVPFCTAYSHLPVLPAAPAQQ